ncbi:Uncharacterised protein [Vibrio cholerae]|uniref:Uncharacterized protein n=1 Tax=Vibrio cholerae TaxID=666 RepID=A0A655X9J4_VIBCL|nr:Uncharacterised protein [Vibrio cholerae]
MPSVLSPNCFSCAFESCLPLWSNSGAFAKIGSPQDMSGVAL